MTLMWRSGTSLQTLVLSFHYAGPRGTKLSHHRLTEPFPLSNLASLKDHLMYNFLLYFYLIGYYVFQKAKKKSHQVFFILSSSTLNTSSKRQPEYQCPRCLPEQSLPVHVSRQSLPVNMCFCYTVMYLYKLYTQHSVFCTSQFLCCSPWCYI